MSTKTWIGVIIIVIMVLGAIGYTYLSTVTTLPPIGLGLAIDQWLFRGILVVAGILLAIWYFRLKPGAKQ